MRSPAPRQAAADGVLGDRDTKTLFDGHKHFGYRQDTIRRSKGAHSSPLDGAIAEPLGLERGPRPAASGA
jgi:hypothetical protein